MTTLSEKYIAGFMDADGTIAMQWTKDCSRPQMVLNFAQKTNRDEVLHKIKEVMGGSLRTNNIKGQDYSILNLCGKTASNCLNRISKYLVIKRHYANFCLDNNHKPCDDKDIAKAIFKEQRKIMSYPLPNFPSRKWLAGYFDGDGCVSISRLTAFDQANIVAHIACSEFDVEGITLIQKSFGGRIHNMCGNRCRQWILSLNPSKANEFLGYFSKHSIVKRDQLLFIKMCAEKMKHYRDGINIKSALKHMKTREQRLSDSEVADLYSNIKDLPQRKRTDYGEFIRDHGKIIGKRKAA